VILEERPQYHLPELPQYHLLELRGKAGQVQDQNRPSPEGQIFLRKGQRSDVRGQGKIDRGRL